MNKRYIGIALVIIGIALAAWGYNVYSSVGSELGRAFSGNTPIKAWIGMVGGAICVVIGVIRLK